MKSRLVLGVSVLVLLCFLFLMGSQAFAKKDSKYLIGGAIMNLGWPWFLGTMEGMKKVADQRGDVELIFEDGKFDISTQIQQLENMAQLGVDGIVVFPVDGKAIIPTMVELSKKGIKLVVCDYPQSPDRPEDIVWETFVGHDFRAMGEVAGEIAVKYLKTLDTDKPVCVYLTLPPSGQASVDRFEGFITPIRKEFPNAVVIEQGDPGGTMDSAQTVFENLLTTVPHIDVVCGHNDALVLGAYNAAVAQKRTEMRFIGLAGQKEVLQYLEEGNPLWLGEVLQDPVVLGEAGITALLETLEGKKLPERYPLIRPEAITPENINKYDWKSWRWLGL